MQDGVLKGNLKGYLNAIISRQEVDIILVKRL